MTMLTTRNRAYQPAQAGVISTANDTFADRISDDDDALLELEQQYTPRHKSKRPNCYVRLISTYPIVVAFISFILGGLSFITLAKYPLPSFKDPTAGFEARGTAISGAHRTMKLMREKFDYHPNISLALQALNMTEELLDMFDQLTGYEPLPDPNPPHIKKPVQHHSEAPHDDTSKTTKSVHSTAKPPSSPPWTTTSFQPTELQDTKINNTVMHYKSFNDKSKKSLSRLKSKAKPQWMQQIKLSRTKRSAPDTVCYNIDQNSVKLIFEDKHHGNLWTPDAMKAICRLQDDVVMSSLKPFAKIERCLFSSLPSMMAGYLGKSCSDLNDADLAQMLEIVRACQPYACHHGCPDPPPSCLHFNGVPLSMAYFLMDTGFFKDNSSKPFLKYSMLFYSQNVSWFDIIHFDEYYQATFENSRLSNDYVRISAVYAQLSDKIDLFNVYLMADLKYFIVAGVLVLTILTVYLGSFSLLLATIINVILSLAVAFFIYRVVMGISFFPFMNVLAGIILIAVGADDVFVFYDTYQLVKQKSADNAPREQVMARTFRHAAVSIFVTSFTTSAAFFANYVSRIAAVRCFGIFAGLAILANFFFMITWTPSVIVLVDQVCGWMKRKFALPHSCVKCFNLFKECRAVCGKVTTILYGRAFPFLVNRLWVLCIFPLLILGIGGFIVVFVKPKLKLPDSKEFPLFPASHLMENYDQNLHDKFRWQLEEAEQEELTVYFMWGASNSDNGNHLDPNDDGHLNIDDKFDILAPESQVWMKDFCQKLKKANFTDPILSDVDCLFDVIESTLKDICQNLHPYFKLPMLASTNIPVCCERPTLPLKAATFQICLPLLLKYATKNRVLGKILFDDSNRPAGFQLGIKTKQSPTTSYVKMDNLVTQINSFLESESEKAPVSVKNGWYVGTDSFIFFDLQKAIAHGSYSSIELSVAVACITMFLCSLNVMITLYAMVTISLAIAVTIGTLVLMGWQLNIVESVTISLAVGMSIDFTIHFGVAYVLASTSKSKDRVNDAFLRVGSAVFMAALTTFVAGASVMPSRIKAYTQLGLFLMLVMTTSWIYANFFFQSLCSILGPKGNFCQIPMPWKGCKNQQHFESQAAAEQLDIHSLSSVDSDESDDDVALILNG